MKSDGDIWFQSEVTSSIFTPTHLKEEDDHGEGEARDGADEDSADGAETDAVRVIEHGAVVLEVGRPVTSC